MSAQEFKVFPLHQMDIDWAVERLPKSVYSLMKESGDGLVLAGGYIRSVISGDPVNDIDLFTTNPVTALRLAREYTHAVNGKLFTSENAYSVRDPTVNGLQVQFIHRWSYPNAVDLLKSFDFTIGQAAIWLPLQQAAQGICAESYYQDLASKRLVYTNPTREEAVGGSLLRVLKFYQRGFRVPLNSLADIIARVAEKAEAVKWDKGTEPESLSSTILNLLHEVDPHTDPARRAYTPISALHLRKSDEIDPKEGYEVFGWKPPINQSASQVTQ